MYYKKQGVALASWLSWLKHLAVDQKIAGLIPSQGAYLGCGVWPLVRECTGGNWLMFLSLQCFSLSLLPSVGSVNIPLVFFFFFKTKKEWYFGEVVYMPWFQQLLPGTSLSWLFICEWGFLFYCSSTVSFFKSVYETYIFIFLQTRAGGWEGGPEVKPLVVPATWLIHQSKYVTHLFSWLGEGK